MEGLIILVALILSIIALVKVNRAKEDLQQQQHAIHLLQQELLKLRSTEKTAPEPMKAAVPPAAEKAAPKPPPGLPKAAPVPPPPPPKEHPLPKRRNIEAAFGGQIFGLIGVMILVAGIAFLVGSPGISWPAPLAKIWIGLGCGAALLGGGFIAERNKSKKFTVLSRIMTGGGGGMFYFCVFASYSLYHLSGPVVSAAGLTLSAALLLWLSMRYNSQTVSCLGVLGAFITPALVGGDFENGIFPLVYIGLINLPVMILGVKKNWQVLYNGAYLFTLAYFGYWLIAFNSDHWVTPLLATLGYFLEFVTLSLLIMRQRERAETSGLNIARIIASTGFLFISLYIVFDQANISESLGLCFLGIAFLFAALTKIAWKWLPEYKAEPLCFLQAGLVSITLLIIEWTSGIGTGATLSAYGIFLALIALKTSIKPVQNSAIALGFFGLLHATCQPLQRSGTLLINPHTLTGLFSAALIGVQAWLYQKVLNSQHINKKSRRLWFAAILAILGVSCRNIFTSLPTNQPLAWLLTSAVILFVGAIVTWLMNRDVPLKNFGVLLITFVPIKLLIYDTLYSEIIPNLTTPWPWLQLLLLVIVLELSRRLTYNLKISSGFGPVLQLAPIITGLAILSIALWELQTDWGRAMISILWGSSALIITFYGFMRKSKLHRIFALLLFGGTVLKVGFIDCATFSTGARVVICIGVGLILMTLSFTYQKVSNRLLQTDKIDEE